MTRRALVLGAGGFLGRQLAERLARIGWNVIAGTRSSVRFAHPAIENAVAPYDDAVHFAHVGACDAVLHAASSTTPGSTAARPQLEGNLRPTLALLEALQDAPRARLLYLSSGGTLYGDRPDGTPSEQDPLRPRSYHGAGKAAAEAFIGAWAQQYDGTAIVLRPSNVYGPGQPLRAGFGIVPTAFAHALSGAPLPIWGDGRTVRDYLYVDDLLDLAIAALDAPLGAGSHVFNASAGDGVTLDALLDAIDAVTGRPLRRDYRPRRSVDVRYIVPDAGAARARFDWQPRTPLPGGLEAAWRWFRSVAS